MRGVRGHYKYICRLRVKNNYEIELHIFTAIVILSEQIIIRIRWVETIVVYTTIGVKVALTSKTKIADLVNAYHNGFIVVVT